MSNLNLKSTTEDLLDSFFEAGKIAKEISQRGVKITIKADKSPVTDGDMAVDSILTTKIKNLTPDTPIISEETVNIKIKNNKGWINKINLWGVYKNETFNIPYYLIILDQSYRNEL